jgi:hypothetical protein
MSPWRLMVVGSWQSDDKVFFFVGKYAEIWEHGSLTLSAFLMIVKTG